MPRPRCCRNIAGAPACRIFKPAGLPASSLAEVSLSLDEYEALRLADYEGLYQEDAAARMGVSRQTFGRTIEAARRKVAGALVEGLVLRIGSSEAEAPETETPPQGRGFLCKPCGHAWQEPSDAGRPAACPCCGAHDLQCADVNRACCKNGQRGAKP